MKKITQLIERIGALHRSQLRRYAQEHGLQMVQLEVLAYLHQANRYSDTVQALSDYLGQTKSSISQTVGFLEKEGYISRIQDLRDKRVFHLIPSKDSRKLVDGFEERFYGDIDFEAMTEASLTQVLSEIQKRNGMKGFGLCSTCRFNSSTSSDTFFCGLTGESLTRADLKLKCREQVLKTDEEIF